MQEKPDLKRKNHSFSELQKGGRSANPKYANLRTLINYLLDFRTLRNCGTLWISDLRTYTVKKVSDFPVPSRDVTNQTLPGRE
jgi:hypothetical protein